MKERAVVFDFDGTLIAGGLDKGVHVLYAAWVSCFSHGFRDFLHPDALSLDIERMLRAYVRFPGAPRFEQLAAVVNALVGDPAGLGPDSELYGRYEKVRREYNILYSGLNETAAQTYWEPFPSVRKILPHLAKEFDLYIASGVVQEILDEDFAHHNFDREFFCGIFGSENDGERNKGIILAELKASGYREILFLGDSTKDQEYAVFAGVRFFRIREDADFKRLMEGSLFDLPDEKEPWTFSPEELQFYREKSEYILRAFISGKPLEHTEICRWINS